MIPCQWHLVIRRAGKSMCWRGFCREGRCVHERRGGRARLGAVTLGRKAELAGGLSGVKV